MPFLNDIKKQNWFVLMNYIFMFFMFSTSYAAVNAFDIAVNHPPIPILDEQGTNVLESKKPYSPKQTCAGSGCHDYDAITHAYHFEMGRDESDDNYGAKRGLPHLVSPGYFGGYTCMGGSNPQVLAKKNNSSAEEFADFGAAGWVKSCMSCHTGGGWAEKDREGIRYDEKKLADIKPLDGDYYNPVVNHQTGETTIELWDWKKSGVGEADCMFCHLDFSTRKLPEDSGLEEMLTARKSRQAFTTKGYFRETATGLMETVLNSDGKNLLTVVREEGEFALDDNGSPQFDWHADAFDENGRAVIPMLRFPGNTNCMECHRTSNSRRGFYGFGESAEATLVNAGEDASDGVLEDDYQDDVHKGKVYVDDNGQSRSIESCNSCHSKQYYKSNFAAIDLDANHDFPKGNSDMDVRNDLDYAPNAKSCEDCHINSANPIIPSKHDTLLNAHRELWKGNGDMAGYSQSSLTRITQTHFDVVACQTCHIVGKKSRGNDIQLLYRYRKAEDGKLKMTPYNPRLRYRWLDKVSGRVLVKTERNAIFEKGEDAEGNLFGNIVDPISGEILGQVSARDGRHGFSYGDPDSYESFVAVKKAYDSLLRKKGYNNPDTTLMWSESNEYIISHNTRPSPDSMQCEECHSRKQSGAFSSLVSPEGVLGTANEKTVTTIPDNRLVEEGIITLELDYMKLQSNGDVTQNVSDILFTTKIDPFMTLLKNSSAGEVIGEFQKVDTDALLSAVGTELANVMSGDLVSTNAFLFNINKGNISLRNMGAVIDGNTVNSILFPTFRASLGMVEGAEQAAQDLLDARQYGKLRSDVFYFDVLDSAKNHVSDLNNTPMFIKVAYKGTRTDPNTINIVMANWDVNEISLIDSADVLIVEPATADGDEGYVIFKTNELGYFIVADK